MKNIVVRKETLIFFPMAIFFALWAALRGDTPDTYNYKLIYENISMYSLHPSIFYNQTYMEVGYGYLSKIFKYFEVDFRFFLFFYSLLIFVFIKLAAQNFKINAIFVLLCYVSTFYYYQQWMQIRQGLAVAIGFYMISVIMLNRSKIKSFFLYFFAIISHNVLFPFLVFFLLFNKRIKSFFDDESFKYFLKVFFVFTFVFLMCRLMSSSGLLNVDRVQTYSSLEEERSIWHPANIRGYVLLILFLIFNNKKNNILNFLILIYAVGVSIRIGFYDFLILSGRLSNVFVFSEIFIISMIVSMRFGRVLACIIILTYFCLSTYLTLEFQLPELLDLYKMPLP